MSQSFQTIIPIVLVSISAFIVNPAQAESLGESNNNNANIKSNEISQSNDLNKSTNNTTDVLSENSDTSSTSTAVTTTETNSNRRIPISSRIFAVPSMQQ